MPPLNKVLTAGIEVGTSWHCVREARKRNWGVAIIDPNARGETVGYQSFKKSVSKLFVMDKKSSSSAAAGEDGNDGENKNTAVETTASTIQLPVQQMMMEIYHQAEGGTTIMLLHHQTHYQRHPNLSSSPSRNTQSTS